MPNNNQEKPNFYKLYEKVGKIEGIVQQMDRRLDSVIKEHGKRINKVESDIDQMKGKSAIIGGVAGFLVAFAGIVITFFKE